MKTAMKYDLGFMGVCSVVLIAAVFLLGLMGSTVGILVCSALAAVVASRVTGRYQAHGRVRVQWGGLLLCAAVPAAVFASLHLGYLMILMQVVSITGSPYDVPDINLPVTLLLSFVKVFLVIWAALALHDLISVKSQLQTAI